MKTDKYIIHVELCIILLSPIVPGKRTNLALNKTAYQSTLYSQRGGDASHAVDGNTDSNFHNYSCTHTNEKSDDWWEVDLGSPYNIKEVIVYNRLDCCAYRLGNYILSGGIDCVHTESRKCYTECYHQQTEDPVHVLRPNNCTARYIRIATQLQDVLTLCEVEVFDELLKGATVTSTEDTSATIPDTITTTADVNTPEVSLFTTEERSSITEDASTTTENIVTTTEVTPGTTKDTTTTITTEDSLTSTEDSLVSTEDMTTTIITTTTTNTTPKYKINATENVETTAEYMKATTEDKSTTPTDKTKPNYTRTTTEGSISTVADIINTTEDITHTIKETNIPTTEWTSAIWQMNNSIKARSCGCFCHVVYQPQQDNKHIIEAYKEEISRKLVVPIKTLSKTIQKKISTEDRRPSAVYCGYIGIVAIVVSLGGFVIADFVSCLSYIHRCINQ